MTQQTTLLLLPLSVTTTVTPHMAQGPSPGTNVSVSVAVDSVSHVPVDSTQESTQAIAFYKLSMISENSTFLGLISRISLTRKSTAFWPLNQSLIHWVIHGHDHAHRVISIDSNLIGWNSIHGCITANSLMACTAMFAFSFPHTRLLILGKFVLEPFGYWTKTKDRATEHAKSEYRHNAMSIMAVFLARYKSPSQAVDVLLNSQLKQTIETNQKVIESLLQITTLCGKQGFALCGQSDYKLNENNFVALVCFRAETDTVLFAHLQKLKRMASTLPKTIQNVSLSVVGDRIHSSII